MTKRATSVNWILLSAVTTFSDHDILTDVLVHLCSNSNRCQLRTVIDQLIGDDIFEPGGELPHAFGSRSGHDTACGQAKLHRQLPKEPPHLYNEENRYSEVPVPRGWQRPQRSDSYWRSGAIYHCQ